MTDSLLIGDLRLQAKVGVPKEERARPQEVLIQVEVSTNLSAASASDDLADAIDYGELLDTIEGVVGGGSFALLEHLAGTVVDAVYEFGGVTGVTVDVEKTAPPVSQQVGRVAVRIER